MLTTAVPNKASAFYMGAGPSMSCTHPSQVKRYLTPSSPHPPCTTVNTACKRRMHLLYATCGMFISSPYHHCTCIYHIFSLQQMNQSIHFHQILLYSLQHQLPTRSVLHQDDSHDLPHTVEFRCPEQYRKGTKASYMRLSESKEEERMR